MTCLLRLRALVNFEFLSRIPSRIYGLTLIGVAYLVPWIIKLYYPSWCQHDQEILCLVLYIRVRSGYEDARCLLTSRHEAFHFQNIMATAVIKMNPGKYSPIFSRERHKGISAEHENQLHDT